MPHTSGQWELSDTVFGDARYEIISGDTPPNTIGWVCRKPTKSEAEANARLMKAAPDLLKAAEATLDMLAEIEAGEQERKLLQEAVDAAYPE